MQAGIELSDDEHDLDPFEDDLAVRGKGGRKTGGRQTGTADAAASAQQLQKVQRWPQCCGFVHHAFAVGAMHRCCWLGQAASWLLHDRDGFAITLMTNTLVCRWLTHA